MEVKADWSSYSRMSKGKITPGITGLLEGGELNEQTIKRQSHRGSSSLAMGSSTLRRVLQYFPVAAEGLLRRRWTSICAS